MLMSEETEKVRATVVSLIRGGSLKKLIDDVEVEPDVDEEGNEFLRISVKLKGREPDDTELEELLESIETAVLNIDTRYPSVRFLDAA